MLGFGDQKLESNHLMRVKSICLIDAAINLRIGVQIFTLFNFKANKPKF